MCCCFQGHTHLWIFGWDCLFGKYLDYVIISLKGFALIPLICQLIGLSLNTWDTRVLLLHFSEKKWNPCCSTLSLPSAMCLSFIGSFVLFLSCFSFLHTLPCSKRLNRHSYCVQRLEMRRLESIAVLTSRQKITNKLSGSLPSIVLCSGPTGRKCSCTGW